MSNKYDLSQIPAGWLYCFNEQCPQHAHCLRFQSKEAMPEDVNCVSAVNPSLIKDGGCRLYRKDEKVTLATGFVIKGNPHVSSLFVAMRQKLTDYLGGNGTYYLYRNGKKWLSPVQQEDIRRIFRHAGYTDEIVFAHTKEAYDFT